MRRSESLIFGLTLRSEISVFAGTSGHFGELVTQPEMASVSLGTGMEDS